MNEFRLARIFFLCRRMDGGLRPQSPAQFFSNYVPIGCP